MAPRRCTTTSRVLFGWAATLATSTAYAQETREAIVRRDLLAQAEEARLARDHATAIDRALRAAALRMTPSIRYFLAREYEATGRPLETLEQAGACARDAEADAALRNRALLLSACRAIVARTEPRIGHVTVRVAPPLPAGATVRVAGNALTDAVLGLPYPVEPGAVRVEASAPRYDPWSRELAVAAGATVDVDVALVATAPPPPPPPQVVAPPPVVAVGLPPPVRAARSVTPLVVGGAAAVASFAAAGALFAASMGARGERDDACGGVPLRCDPSAQDADARYRGFAYAGDAALGVGAASLIAGGLFWWLLRPSAPAQRGVQVAPAVSAGAVGASVVISR